VAEFVESEPQVNKEWLEKFTRFYSKTEGGHSK